MGRGNLLWGQFFFIQFELIEAAFIKTARPRAGTNEEALAGVGGIKGPHALVVELSIEIPF